MKLSAPYSIYLTGLEPDDLGELVKLAKRLGLNAELSGDQLRIYSGALDGDTSLSGFAMLQTLAMQQSGQDTIEILERMLQQQGVPMHSPFTEISELTARA